jgi:hypothetical protein
MSSAAVSRPVALNLTPELILSSLDISYCRIPLWIV